MGFAHASHSEVLRAAQKDTFYCESLVEQVQSALSALVDRPLSLRPATIRAVTALTYYALTTGRSSQTLGEEYCELTQVAASDRLPASAPRRWLGLLVHVLLPYWSQRLEARLVAFARRCEEGQRPLLQVRANTTRRRACPLHSCSARPSAPYPLSPSCSSSRLCACPAGLRPFDASAP